MKSIILKENVLTDNELLMPDNGMIFKGGYIAIIKEYSFQNAWSDKENITRFRSEKRLLDFIDKNYPEAWDLIEFN